MLIENQLSGTEPVKQTPRQMGITKWILWRLDPYVDCIAPPSRPSARQHYIIFNYIFFALSCRKDWQASPAWTLFTMRHLCPLSSCYLHLLCVLLHLVSLPHFTSATQAATAYNPINLPNPLVQQVRRRPIHSMSAARATLNRGRQIAYAPKCDGNLLMEGDPPWRPGHALEPYITWQQLCAARDFGGLVHPDKRPANMGGTCFQNLMARNHGFPGMVAWFDFDEDEADPNFYATVGLRHRCYEWCHCETLRPGMHYSMVQLNHERHRPLGDIEINSIPGMTGWWPDKEGKPILMVEFQNGAYKEQSSGGNVDDSGVSNTVWQVPDKSKPDCKNMVASKGPLLLGLVDATVAACLGWDNINGKRDLDMMEEESE